MTITEPVPNSADNHGPIAIAVKLITRRAARALADAALEAGVRIGVSLAVAVVDPGGHLLAFEREETTPSSSIDAAVGKAWTAASYRVTTDYWNDYVRDHPVAPLAGASRVLAVGGGYPLFEAGEVIGAIGVAGGSLEQDQKAALEAIAVVGLNVG